VDITVAVEEEKEATKMATETVSTTTALHILETKRPTMLMPVLMLFSTRICPSQVKISSTFQKC